MNKPPPPAHAKVRWGVLSTALIGTEKVIPALRKAHKVGVVAIASPSMSAARAAADALGIATAHGSYEALLADPAIEVLGSRSCIEIEIPFNAPQHAACRWGLDIADALGDSTLRWTRGEVQHL